MIAPVRQSAPTQPTWHTAFLAMLPTIRESARFSFRHLDPEARAEAIQEITASAMLAFARLVALGKTDVAYPTVLARYAIAQYRVGRRVGAKLNVRDVMSPAARSCGGVMVDRLDQFDQQDGEWREVLIEDRRVGPAETAAARLDVAAWLGSLNAQEQRIAKRLARSERTGDVARTFGLSAGRVSQLRKKLQKSWLVMQGEVAAV